MAGKSHEQDGVRFRRATRSPLGAALWSARLGGAGIWGAQEELFTSDVHLARLEFVNPLSTLLLNALFILLVILTKLGEVLAPEIHACLCQGASLWHS